MPLLVLPYIQAARAQAPSAQLGFDELAAEKHLNDGLVSANPIYCLVSSRAISGLAIFV